MRSRIRRWRTVARRQQLGQGLTEYGLILVLIAVAAVATLTLLGESVYSLYSYASTTFPH